jgi:hypothetical protein
MKTEKNYFYSGPRFGIRSDTSQPIKITNLPAGVLKIRIRERADNFTRVYLKFSNRIECWLVVEDDDDMNCWRLFELDYGSGCNSENKIL